MDYENQNNENHTGKDNQSKTPFGVSEYTTPQKHFFIIQRVLIVSPE